MKHTYIVIAGSLVIIIIFALLLAVGGRTPTAIAPEVTESDSSDPAPMNQGGNQQNPMFVDNELAGDMWELAAAQNNDNETVIDSLQADSFELTFNTDGTFSATTDCNSLRGQYELADTGITFSNIASTKMACPAGSAEQTFVDILTDTRSYVIREAVPPELILESASGNLSFVAARANPVPDEPSESVPDRGDSLIGMTVAEAEAYAAANDTVFRIGSIDGAFLPVTMDYRPGRITAAIENDIVVDYTVE